MDVWIESLSKTEFEVCLRESRTFDGPHSNLSVVCHKRSYGKFTTSKNKNFHSIFRHQWLLSCPFVSLLHFLQSQKAHWSWGKDLTTGLLSTRLILDVNVRIPAKHQKSFPTYSHCKHFRSVRNPNEKYRRYLQFTFLGFKVSCCTFCSYYLCTLFHVIELDGIWAVFTSSLESGDVLQDFIL